MSELSFFNDEVQRRYEARQGDALAAFAEYNLMGNNTIMFTHTEVLPAFEGQGVGSAIARHVLDEARDAGMQVIPVCQFIAGYIRKHPDYATLVRDNVRRAFKI